MMNEGVPGGWIFIAIYLVVVLVCTVLEWRYRGWISALSKALVALAIPVAGLVLLLLYELIGQVLGLMRRTGPDEEDEDLSLSIDDPAYSGDIVPLRDTFLLDDAKLKRKFFTDAIKQNVVERQSILTEAVHDSDREIAYYAVSLMTAHMEQLNEEIYTLEEKIKRGVEDDALLDEYVKKVREFLLRQYGDEVTREQQRTRYMEMLRLLAERHPEHPAYRAEEIRELIHGGQMLEAEASCLEMREQHPNDELPLLLLMNVYQASHRREKLLETISALKKLPVRLSNEAMQAIRYWDGGVVHE